MKKLILCFLLFACLFSLKIASSETETPMVRILLKRLALTDRADITIDGSYTLENGILSAGISQGNTLTIQIRDEHLIVHDGIMRWDLGSQLKLIRHAESPQGGLRFVTGGNLYPGDLTIRISGGMLEPVLTLDLETYLLGLVPYEMSADFPLEALKAQAVCARTYALSHLQEQRTWDLTDTTQDQVFMGLGELTANVLDAVQETRGVVGTYQGKLAECYYSASNGGQTETLSGAWSGATDSALYIRKEDPYDLQNPQSPVRTCALPKNTSGWPDALCDRLKEALKPSLRNQGFSENAEDIRLDALEKVNLQTPRYAESHLYTELVFYVHYAGRQNADTNFTPMEDAAMIVLPVFPDLIRDLHLSIAGLDNELLTVVEAADQFVLQSRRYGHGVGMSQRGAEWMAQSVGAHYQQILGFYYPGMQLMQTGTQDRVLTTMRPALHETPQPSATPTPRPTLMPVTQSLTEGMTLARVEGVEDNSSLNLRAEPNQASAILMRLYKHQELVVLEILEDGIWAHVKTDSIEGYCMLSFLEMVSGQ